ncbi:hypothetical protein CgunFtcFv8_010098 [Champsocephalus gunnari]|uniref:Uncharacterized protein n=1 Tax=Champsocephalus gunnari TaxID=52237 RepID=A0AAN8HUV9_CHAGU|nr:hypothetical protein CgunFtcFv8_010098 [Champsocephalus gunnari]
MILLSSGNKRGRRPPLHPDPPPQGKMEGFSPPWGVQTPDPGPLRVPCGRAGAEGKSCSRLRKECEHRLTPDHRREGERARERGH